MKQVSRCEKCQKNAKGKLYEFHYGQFLGNTDFSTSGYGSRSWKENYRILGAGSCFICDTCVSHEYWKRLFKEPRLPEMRIRCFSSLTLFLGCILGFGMFGGLMKLAGLIGLTISNLPIFWPLCIAFSVVAVIMITKLISNSMELGNEMAYRMKFEESAVTNLICIPPSKYKRLRFTGMRPRGNKN